MSKSIPNSARDSNSHTVTILTCTGNRYAAKTHKRAADGSVFTGKFTVSQYLEYETVTFDGLRGLFKLIKKLATNPRKFVIRGGLRSDAPQRNDGCVCRTSRRQPDGEEPYFEEVALAWAMIDLDKLENPNVLDPISIEAMQYIRSLLPPEFHDVACVYSLSASAGFSESSRISGHLWFVFDRSVSSQELKVWLAGYPVDKKLFQCVQPHFIASPVFRDGIVDPIGGDRNGLLPGSHTVVSVPDIDLRKPVYSGDAGAGVGLEAARGYEAKMALLGDGEGLEGCHDVITPAVAAYMTKHGPQADRRALKSDVRKRAAAAPWDRAKHSDAYVAHEVSDETLDRSIQDWIDKTFIIGAAYSSSVLDDLETARGKISGAIDRFFQEASHWHQKIDAWTERLPFFKTEKIRQMFPPPRHGLEGQVALGKTEAYLARLSVLISSLRRGHCVLIAVPNHKLSRELLHRAQAHGLDVDVYLGPAQDDPDLAGKTMCLVPEHLASFQSAGVAQKLCGVCPHRAECGYLKQRRKKAEVWIAAHQIIYRKRRRPIPPVDYVIVDEDPVSAGLEGDNPKDPKFLSSSEVPSDVRRVMERLPLGKAFSRDDFGILDQRLHELIRHAYSNKRAIELSEDCSQEEIEAAAETAKANARCIDQAGFYRAILSDGPWGMRAVQIKDGTIVLKWLRQRKIHRDFDVPMLFTDATANWDATRHLIDCDQSPPGYKGEPFVDEDGSIAIDYDYPFDPIIGSITVAKAGTPNVSYRQVLFSGAAAKLNDSDSGQKAVKKVRRYIEARSVYRQRVLVICQLGLETKLLDLGLPPNVEVAHFNAVRGRDEWNDIDLLIVIGRTQPPPSAMELQAETLFRATCKTLGPDYYDQAWTPLTGSNEKVDVEQHPDHLAEMMRWRVCEAELIQAVGRGRGVNRTADNPLQVDLINKVPLPDIEIDEVVKWDDAQPGPGMVIAGRHGLLLAEGSSKGTANVVAALLPDLFDTVSAAKQANVYSRAETPNKEYYIGVSAREYTSGPPPDIAPLIAVKAAGCHFAVLAYAVRPPTRRPLEKNEKPPIGADVNEDGVLAYGTVYVLKELPRRLKAKLAG
jgi:hypothetical protein